MFKTSVTERLGIRYPLIGGTMMHITDSDFVAAISEAGGLGILASAIYRSKQEFGAAIDRTRRLTDKPFAVNINLFPAMQPIDNNEYTDVLLDRNVKIVETSGHSAPEELSKRWKDARITWIHKCVGVRYARKAASLGADMVTVVGYENGGATGKLDIGTLVLVPSVVDAIDVPVIGGGGVSDGRGLLALLALGAGAAIVGTRVMATKECPLHPDLKQALVNASETDTMLVMRSIGATHRVWANPAATRLADLDRRGATLEEILDVASGEKAKTMFFQGDLEAGMISCGQGVGLVKDIPTVRELFERMMKEAEQTARILAAD